MKRFAENEQFARQPQKETVKAPPAFAPRLPRASGSIPDAFPSVPFAFRDASVKFNRKTLERVLSQLAN